MKVRHLLSISLLILLLGCTTTETITPSTAIQDPALTPIIVFDGPISTPLPVCPEIDSSIKLDLSSTLPNHPNKLDKPILEFLGKGGDPNEVIKTLTDENTPLVRETKFLDQDITGDGIPELSISQVHLWIFGCRNGQYVTLLEVSNYDWTRFPAPWIVSVQDLNSNGVLDFVVKSHYSMTWVEYRIVEWRPNGFQDLLSNQASAALLTKSEASLVIQNGEVFFDDTDNDGVQDVFFRGYDPLPDGLPSRGEEYRYRWDGNLYRIASLRYSAPIYRFEAVQDGDRYSLAGEYDNALSSYQDAITNKDLEWWSSERNRYERVCWRTKPDCDDIPTPPVPDENEYPNLSAYAYFRIMLIHVVNKSLDEAENVYNLLQIQFPAMQGGYHYAVMAGEFWNEYRISNDIEAACAKAIDYAEANPIEILFYLGNGEYSSIYFGEQSLEYTPYDVCPFK